MTSLVRLPMSGVMTVNLFMPRFSSIMLFIVFNLDNGYICYIPI